MTDIELLREAARLMRERATAASPSPWARPKLAGSVADWLDAEADLHEMVAIADVTVRVVTESKYRIRSLESTLPQAVAVARAYLGVES